MSKIIIHISGASGSGKTFLGNQLKEKFDAVPAHKIRFIACHHPVKEDKNLHQALAVRPHFILWGHEHQSGVIKKDNTLMLASGTSASSRTRTEANSFNYITIEGQRAVIEIYRHSKLLKAFEVIDRQEFDI